MHDVVVVGAGIAGSAVAIHLAKAGADVLVVDRAAFPRRKPCGEGLFPAGVRELERLDVLPALAGASAPLRELRFHAGRATADAPLAGLGVQRALLDSALLDRARAAGASVATGVAVRGLRTGGGLVAAVRTDGGDIEARAFVAADGLHSPLRRAAGLARPRRGSRFGVTAHARASQKPPGAVQVFFERDHEIYLTPVGDGLLNVAVLGRRPFMKRFAGDPTAALAALLEGHRAFLRGVELIDQAMAAGPFPAGCRRAWRANFVLAGDAAGFFDGISGEGMSVALATAPDCAAAVLRYLSTSDLAAFRRYDARRRAASRNSDLLARLTLSLAARPAVAERAVRSLARWPGTFARLVAISSGEAPLRSLRPWDMALLGAEMVRK
jgi:flavin-dependent dehydrogenase